MAPRDALRALSVVVVVLVSPVWGARSAVSPRARLPRVTEEPRGHQPPTGGVPTRPRPSRTALPQALSAPAFRSAVPMVWAGASHAPHARPLHRHRPRPPPGASSVPPSFPGSFARPPPSRRTPPGRPPTTSPRPSSAPGGGSRGCSAPASTRRPLLPPRHPTRPAAAAPGTASSMRPGPAPAPPAARVAPPGAYAPPARSPTLARPSRASGAGLPPRLGPRRRLPPPESTRPPAPAPRTASPTPPPAASASPPGARAPPGTTSAPAWSARCWGSRARRAEKVTRGDAAPAAAPPGRDGRSRRTAE